MILPEGETYMSYLDEELNLDIETNMDFILRPLGRCAWMSYQKNKNSLYFKVEKNESEHPRTCRFLILNENCNLSDTLTIVQRGNPGVVLPPEQGEGEDGGSGGGDNADPDDEPGRCIAITQKGTRCKRQAAPGSLYCWQHQKK